MHINCIEIQHRLIVTIFYQSQRFYVIDFYQSQRLHVVIWKYRAVYMLFFMTKHSIDMLSFYISQGLRVHVIIFDQSQR